MSDEASITERIARAIEAEAARWESSARSAGMIGHLNTKYRIVGLREAARIARETVVKPTTPCHHCGRPIEGHTAGLAFCGKPCVVACAMTLPLGEPPVSEISIRGIIGVRPGTFGEAMRRAAHEGGEGGR